LTCQPHNEEASFDMTDVPQLPGLDGLGDPFPPRETGIHQLHDDLRKSVCLEEPVNSQAQAFQCVSDESLQLSLQSLKRCFVRPWWKLPGWNFTGEADAILCTTRRHEALFAAERFTPFSTVIIPRGETGCHVDGFSKKARHSVQPNAARKAT